MRMEFNLTKEARRALVRAVSEITGFEEEYQGAPGFEFVVGGITIDRYGTLIFDERVTSEDVGLLIEGLVARGITAGTHSVEADDLAEHEETGSADVSGEAVSPAPADKEERREIQPEMIKLHEELSQSDDDVTAYYLLLCADAAAAALTHETLSLVKERANKYIICAELCYLSEDEKARWSITFRKMPRDWNLLPNTVQEQIRALNPEYEAQYLETEHIPYISEYDEVSGRLPIHMPLYGFTPASLDNLEKLVAAKAWILKRMSGAEELPIERDERSLRFPWFKPDASPVEVDAYSRLIAGLCETAKTKKRVMSAERQLEDGDNEKFKARCFLLSIGFIGDQYKQARKILLSPFSGNGSHKTGSGKKRATEGAAAADNGAETAEAISVRDDVSGAGNADVGGETAAYNDGDSARDAADTAAPLKCGECLHHCYYSDGAMLTSAGDIVDTSKRTPDKYTHYCLNTPRGFRKLKHAAEWSGFETAPKWCPLYSVPETAAVPGSGEESPVAVSREDNSEAGNAPTDGEEAVI